MSDAIDSDDDQLWPKSNAEHADVMSRMRRNFLEGKSIDEALELRRKTIEGSEPNGRDDSEESTADDGRDRSDDGSGTQRE